MKSLYRAISLHRTFAMAQNADITSVDITFFFTSHKYDLHMAISFGTEV